MRNDHRTDSEVILYETEDGKSRLEVRFSGETAWLSLNQLADRVIANFATTATDGKVYEVSSPIRQQLLQNMQQFVEKDFEKAVKKLPKPTKGH